MIITCPSCQARFNVNSSKLGPKGRRVRCSKCGNHWHQAAPKPVIPLDITPDSETDIEPAVEIEASEARALFGMTEPERPEATEPPDSLFEKLSTPAPEPKAPLSSPAEVPAEPAAPPVARAPLQPLKPEKAPVKAPDRAESWTTKPAKSPESQRRPTGVTWGAIVLALLVLGLVSMHGRGWISHNIPGAEGVYRALGLGDLPGSGLVLRQVTSERLVLDGTDSLVIEGVIANSGAGARVVPPIEARFADGTAHETLIEAEDADLAPGEETRFKITLAAPPGIDKLSLHFLDPR